MARVSVALGASVALHVLGAVVLWRGASEPETPRQGGPLEVRVVWLEVAERVGPTGSGPSAPEAPTPDRTPRRVSRPARSRGKVPDMPAPEARAEAPALPEDPGPSPAAGGQLEAPAPVDPATPGGFVHGGAPGSAPVVDSQVGAPGGGSPGPGPSGGGSPGGGAGAGGDPALLAYREQLARRVTRQRRYPSQAVRLGMEGTVLVWVRINRDGALAAPPRLEGSSRFRVLDAEALRMVEAAAPFSPLPSEPLRESAEFVIPVSFSLRAITG